MSGNYNFNKKNCFLMLSIFIPLIFIMVIILDYHFYITYPNTLRKKEPVKQYIRSYEEKTEKEIEDKYIFDKDEIRAFRRVENENSSEKPIVLFGFSGVYGLNLAQNETPSYILGQLTSHPIYNRAKPESSLNHMYYQLSNKDFYKIIPKPKYIFYFYSPKQFVLMNNKLDFCQHDIYYKNKNGKLERLKKIPLKKRSYLISKINRILFKKGILENYSYKKDKELFENILIQSKKEAEKHWGEDIEFVIIRLKGKGNENENKIFKNLESKGFVVFELNKYLDISAKKYKENKTSRLNAYFWKDCINILSKELKL